MKPPPIPRAASPARPVLSSSIQAPLSSAVPHPSTPRHDSSIIPPPSPSPKRVRGRSPHTNVDAMSSSLPALPSSSSAVEPLSTPTRDPKKRARPQADGDDEPMLKKARTVPMYGVRPEQKKVNAQILPGSSSINEIPRTPAPAVVDVSSSTRPKQTAGLPTLTELLASSKKMKQSKIKSRLQQQKEEGQLKNNDGDKDVPARKDEEEQHPLDQGCGRLQTNEKQKEPEKPSSKTNVFKERTQYSPIPGLLHASPAKSLSSIAGSDSEDSDDELEKPTMFADGLGLGSAFTQDPNRFRPDLVSTQLGQEKSGWGNGSVDMDIGGHSQSQSQSHSQSQTESVVKGSSGIFRYNSQYDVNREVDLVSGILGKEVDLNEWLRDVSDDEDGDD